MCICAILNVCFLLDVIFSDLCNNSINCLEGCIFGGEELWEPSGLSVLKSCEPRTIFGTNQVASGRAGRHTSLTGSDYTANYNRTIPIGPAMPDAIQLGSTGDVIPSRQSG